MNRPSPVRLEVVLCLMPWELRHFERQLSLFQETAREQERDRIFFDVSLVTSPNIISWKDSGISRDAVEERFRSLCAASALPGRFVIERGPQILGCVDKRREHAKHCDPSSSVCWLDADIHFPPWTLSALLSVLPKVPEPLFILSPQVPKLWDHTWDLLVHENFREKEYGFCFQYDPAQDPALQSPVRKEISLVALPEIKFAGGWCTVFPAALLQGIGIPRAFPPYGLEDTYLMKVIHQLNRFGWGVQQYLLEGLLVAETYVDEETNRLRQQCVLVESTKHQAQRAQQLLQKEVAKTVLRLLPGCLQQSWLRRR